MVFSKFASQLENNRQAILNCEQFLESSNTIEYRYLRVRTILMFKCLGIVRIHTTQVRLDTQVPTYRLYNRTTFLRTIFATFDFTVDSEVLNAFHTYTQQRRTRERVRPGKHYHHFSVIDVCIYCIGIALYWTR